MGSLDPAKKKLIYRIIFFIMVAGLALFVVRIFDRLPNEIELAYDLSRYGRSAVRELHVAIMRNGEKVHSTSFMMKAGRPGKFEHRPKLVKGFYKLVIKVIEMSGRRKTLIRAIRSPQKGARIFHISPSPNAGL